MTPTRLPRPGQVQEVCRLCGAVLVLSVENPRRVCAACGEVNLPSDHAVAPAPAVLNASRPLPEKPPMLRVEALQFLLGAGTPVLACTGALILNIVAFLVGVEQAHIGWLLPAAMVTSWVAAWRLHARTGGSGFRAMVAWTGGLLAGLGLSYALVTGVLYLLVKLIWH